MDKYSNRSESREALIAAMTEGLAPVKRVKPAEGALLIGFAALVASLASVAVFDFWSGMVTGDASGYFWITNGLLLLLGAACTSALVASALPRVGARSSAPLWSAAMLGVIPVAAIISILSLEAAHDHSSGAISPLADPTTWYWQCAAYGLAASVLVGIAAVMFLRRAAPVSIERAGWLTGLAAGALGSVAYGVTCPLDSIAHVGIWHAVPVAVGAIAGRLVVPPFIRW